ncbi:hypothetical protein [Lysinibacillus contaminans]|uniref:hypothetical protein n=1 Tax=Lysinibacillus contaminans TaxID=1293441 RepID=UPI000A64DBA5|nr:hypothetical protein [Lysinibacillus contaminans]
MLMDLVFLLSQNMDILEKEELLKSLTSNELKIVTDVLNSDRSSIIPTSATWYPS